MKKIMIAALLLAMALLPVCGWAADDIFTAGSHNFDGVHTYTLENRNGEDAISLDKQVYWMKKDDTPPTVKLILKGKNAIKLTTLEAGISTIGVNVTIETDPADPDASLEIIKDFSGTGSNDAFNVGSAKLTIKSGNVTVRNKSQSAAISANELEVSGGSLTAESEAEDDPAIMVYSGKMTVSGGKVTATSGKWDGIDFRGGSMTISGGEVTATGGEKTGGESYAGISKEVELDGVTASHSDDGKSWEAYTGGSVKRYFRSPAVAAAADSAGLPQTGDSSALFAWAVLLGASCLLLRRRAMN